MGDQADGGNHSGAKSLPATCPVVGSDRKNRECVRVTIPFPAAGVPLTEGHDAETVVLRWEIVDGEQLDQERFGQLAQKMSLILLLTIPEPLAVMDTYKLIKKLAALRLQQKLVVAVLCEQSEAVGHEMSQRLRTACERFMGFVPRTVVIDDSHGRGGNGGQQPVVSGNVSHTTGRAGARSHDSAKQQHPRKGFPALMESLFELVCHLVSAAPSQEPAGHITLPIKEKEFNDEAEFVGRAIPVGQGEEAKAAKNG